MENDLGAMRIISRVYQSMHSGFFFFFPLFFFAFFVLFFFCVCALVARVVRAAHNPYIQ